MLSIAKLLCPLRAMVVTWVSNESILDIPLSYNLLIQYNMIFIFHFTCFYIYILLV